MPTLSFARQFYTVAMLVILSLATGGCVRTTYPILRDDQVVANDTLLGRWVSRDGKISAELKPGENNLYKLSYTNEDGKTGAFLLRFGKLGSADIAEIKADVFNADSSGEFRSLLLPMYMLIVIEKTAPQLVLSAPSPDWLKKYIQDHPDELEVTSVGDQDLIVNSKTEEYQAFFIRHLKDKEMLGDSSIFVHPGDPSTQPTGANPIR